MGGLAVVVLGAWLLSMPPAYIRPAEAYLLPETSAALLAVKATSDDVGTAVLTGPTAPGHDDVVLQEERGQAFLTARDGWIWRLELGSGKAKRFVRTPLVASGAKFLPRDPDRMLFCASHLYGFKPEHEASVGVYELRLSTREIRALALRVPLPPPLKPEGEGGTGRAGGVLNGEGAVYPLATTPALRFADMTEANSRPMAFCNDLDISEDGQRIYVSEPYDYPGAAMGNEAAFREAISLARNGRLWMFDLESKSARLVAQDFHFVDGVLLDSGSESARGGTGREESIVITETPKFRLLRLFVGGPKAGTAEVLQEGLPGMPDGLSRDERGRIYVALYRGRPGSAAWIHANPWIKPLLLRLPPALFPISHETGYLVLDPSGRQPLYLTLHDGHRVSSISKVNPGRDGIFLTSFDHDNQGVHVVGYPAALALQQGNQPGGAASGR
ncbi:SMP-30/gluconolactonase/LRE family protein [Cystobacter ferrugineus]|uniref:SMP-30/gluconolactonase/LRE family protein n=1 Tax=Cystobacter ferrugineus TaxID=83449 RepID=UPI001161512A|nr:SMP-30/gluconolaconase/LRE-like region [Cystobacter ferrugineus]